MQRVRNLDLNGITLSNSSPEDSENLIEEKAVKSARVKGMENKKTSTSKSI